MLKQQIQADLKEALKARDEARLSTLRMLTASITNAEIAKMRKELTEEELVQLFKREMKQRQDAIADYKRGGREDLATKEEGEIEILKKYLPEQMSLQATAAIVEKVIAEMGATSLADFGKVMKEVMAEAKGQVDGATVSKLVKEKLGAKA